MRATNPIYIPRNHLVEDVIAAAVIDRDLRPFGQLADILSKPFEEQPNATRYRDPPHADEIVRATFCGT